MAVDWTSIAVGFGSAVATGAAGLLAFGRQLSSNKALNANDKQQVNNVARELWLIEAGGIIAGNLNATAIPAALSPLEKVQADFEAAAAKAKADFEEFAAFVKHGVSVLGADAEADLVALKGKYL